MPTPLETNTATIREILDKVNQLPDGGGGTSTATIREATREEFVEWVDGGGNGVIEFRGTGSEDPDDLIDLNLSFLFGENAPERLCDVGITSLPYGVSFNVYYDAMIGLSIDSTEGENMFVFEIETIALALEDLPVSGGFIPVLGSDCFLCVKYYIIPESVIFPQS